MQIPIIAAAFVGTPHTCLSRFETIPVALTPKSGVRRAALVQSDDKRIVGLKPLVWGK